MDPGAARNDSISTSPGARNQLINMACGRFRARREVAATSFESLQALATTERVGANGLSACQPGKARLRPMGSASNLAITFSAVGLSIGLRTRVLAAREPALSVPERGSSVGFAIRFNT